MSYDVYVIKITVIKSLIYDFVSGLCSSLKQYGHFFLRLGLSSSVVPQYVQVYLSHIIYLYLLRSSQPPLLLNVFLSLSAQWRLWHQIINLSSENHVPIETRKSEGLEITASKSKELIAQRSKTTNK